MTKSNFFKHTGPIGIYAVVVFTVFSGMQSADAQRRQTVLTGRNGVGGPVPQGFAGTPTPTPTPTASATPTATATATATATPTPTPTATATPTVEINGSGTFTGPNGTQVIFTIFDVEPEQITQNFLEGFLIYFDRGSHVKFGTGKITSVTINGDQAAFSGTCTIGKQKQVVNFTVSLVGNKVSPNEDSFNISLSNGYSAGGPLTKGSISIAPGDE